MIVTLFITVVQITLSYLHYCNRFLTGLPASPWPPAMLIVCGEARASFLKRKSDHVTPLQPELNPDSKSHGCMWSGTWLFPDLTSFYMLFFVLPAYQPLSCSLSLPSLHCSRAFVFTAASIWNAPPLIFLWLLSPHQSGVFSVAAFEQLLSSFSLILLFPMCMFIACLRMKFFKMQELYPSIVDSKIVSGAQ